MLIIIEIEAVGTGETAEIMLGCTSLLDNSGSWQASQPGTIGWAGVGTWKRIPPLRRIQCDETGRLGVLLLENAARPLSVNDQGPGIHDSRRTDRTIPDGAITWTVTNII